MNIETREIANCALFLKDISVKYCSKVFAIQKTIKITIVVDVKSK